MRTRLLLLAFLLATFQVRAAIPQSERDALLAFFNSTNGAQWQNKEGWGGAPGTECNWFGVECDETGATVHVLSFFSNGLSGTIPPQIANLRNLKILVIYNGGLTGTFPIALTQLTNLERLELGSNQFSGPIPREIAALVNLKALWLSDNQLTGAIPPEIGSLRRLENLYLDGNRLTGRIPDEITTLTNLRELFLSRNELEGPLPANLGLLTNLQDLRVDTNRLTGTFPASISGLRALTYLQASSNLFDGPIPSAISQLTALEHLDLGTNAFSGTIPAALGNLANLRELMLPNNRLTGSIPKELGTLARLRSLNVQSNQLSGPLPSELSQLKALEELYLGYNQFSGEVPAWLGDLELLQVLDLTSNSFVGSIPDLSRLKALRQLSLADNTLSGPVPSQLGDLTRLDYLDLYGNELTGTIPSTLARLTNLEALGLGQNLLTGTIPDLSALTKLRILFLNENRLTGGIPSWIGNLAALEVLHLAANQLGGSIPPSITSLKNLRYVDLSANLHTGTLPRDLGNMTALEELYLYQNLLEGTIPELTNLRKLVVLQLESNRLEGRIPALDGLDDLTYLYLGDNSLSGDLPPSLFTRTKLESLGLDANRFSGPFPTGLTQLTNLTDLRISHNAFRGALPRALMNLTRLTNLGLEYNALYTTDAELRDFLNRKLGYPFEESSQTVAPTNIAISDVTDRSAVVTWTPIFYEWDEGGYEITLTPSGGGSPVVVVTPFKYVSSAVVRGLAPSTAYSVTIRTVTYPHDFQRNVVTADAVSAPPVNTGPRVQSPPIVDLAVPPEGLVQVNGTPVNQDSYVLTNYGDLETVVTLVKSGGESFGHSPSTFTLRGGESQTIQLTASSLPFGAHEFYSQPTGTGVTPDLYVPVRVLSVRRPAGTALAQPANSRVEVVGERGTDSIATVTYTNVGTVELTGILVPDVNWIAAPRELIVIAPGETRNINVTVQRSKRPDASVVGGGALSGNLNLLYVDGSGTAEQLGKGFFPADASGVSVSTVTVVDTSKPPVSQSTIPALAAGEVARFIPGVSSAVSSFARSVSDVAVSNAFGTANVSDLRLYYTAANASTASVATMSNVSPSISVSLANVVSNVYNSSGTGTVHVRSQRWSSLLAHARQLNIRNEGSFGGSAPVFRSDRGIAPNAALVLSGLMTGSQHQTTVMIQEMSGNTGTASVEYLNASGTSLSRVDGIAVPAFGLAEVTAAIPPTAIVAVVTNRSTTAARLAAFARVTDRATGDVWSVVDWSRYYDFEAREPVRIPVAQSGGTSSGGGRRRATSHADGPSVATDVLIHNRSTSSAAAQLLFYETSGAVTERQVQLAAKETLQLSNVVSSLFGRSSATGSIVITPLRGVALTVTARTISPFGSGSIGTAIPVIPAASGLRRGQFDVYSGIEESTNAAVTLKLPGTSRTRFGIVETSGQSVKVRATMLVHDGRSLVSTHVAREYTVGPRGMLLIDNLSTSIFGANRDEMFGALHNLQLRFEVIEGEGSAAIFVGNIDNQSGDESLRFE